MSDSHATTADDVAQLKAQLALAQKQLAEREAENATLKREHKTAVKKSQALIEHIAVLEQQLATLRRARFGRKSEQLDDQIQQLELMIEDLEVSADVQSDEGVAEEPEKRTAVKRHPVRQALPEHLPRDSVVHGKREHCEDCGHALHKIGEDVSEVLEYVPASFRVKRHVRPKYRCQCCDTLVQADAPSRPIARGLAGPGLLAHVAVAKYADHLPLYRQSVIYAREGVELSRSTLAGWVGQTVTLIRPLGDALNRYVLGGARVHGDDTPVPVLEPGKKRTRQARLWGYVRDDRAAGINEPPAVWFAYSPDRKGLWPQSHLANFKGTLQADGYAGFDALYANGRVQEAACWAHVRRKFYEIDQVHPNTFAGTVLKHIAELYQIEKEIRGTSVEKRVAARKARAGPILETLKEKLNTVLRTVPRKSPQAKAIHYALKRWDALTVYASDGLIEIDNNPVERQIRPVALGRKNYLFAGSDSGGESAAMMYGLLNTAKLNGLDAEDYLRYVLTRIADHPVSRVGELLPWNVADNIRKLPDQ